MKKHIGLLAVILSISILTSCRNNAADNTITIDGSTSIEKVIGFLSEGYMSVHKDVKITYNPTGSATGIQAVADGRCDIGLSSRKLNAKEARSLTATVVAIDGIAMIVNHANSLNDLSIEEIAKIYTGEIINWKDVGGTEAPIVLIGREAASGTRDGFESITGTENKCRYSQELTSTGDVVQTVASNPNAIGYASLASVKENVKLLSVGGVFPSTETIQSGKYRLQRNFLLITKKDTPLGEAAQIFFDFATSNTANELIIRAGAVPAKH